MYHSFPKKEDFIAGKKLVLSQIKDIITIIEINYQFYINKWFILMYNRCIFSSEQIGKGKYMKRKGINEVIPMEIEMLKRTFDVVRVIEPCQKFELQFNLDTNTVNQIPFHCYRAEHQLDWCNECLVERVFYEKKEFTKFEFMGDRILFVIAKYITYEGKGYVLETVKILRDQMILNAYGDDDFYNKITKYNQEIYQDELTGVYNRRYINERLPGIVQKTMAEGGNISIAMIDIDYFKMINDEYGHTLGDKILCSVSRSILNNVSIRKGDFVARYGGDEFVLVIKDITYNKSCERMRRIAENVKCTEIVYEEEDHRINYSISIGVANSQELEHPTMAGLFELADQRMYMAKKNGRGCMVITGELTDTYN